jgi:hypothetical protein
VVEMNSSFGIEVRIVEDGVSKKKTLIVMGIFRVEIEVKNVFIGEVD